MVLLKSTMKSTDRKKPPLPLDKGWAWLIMFAVYINIMLGVAFSRSLSILLPTILDHYQEPVAVTTLAFGCSDLTWSLTNIAIPTLLLPRFSVRRLALLGACFHSLSLIVLAYSHNMVIFNCIFGVIGFADGLMIVPPLIHLGHFFQKRLSFASAFTQAGGSTATVITPMLTQFLMDTYGFQGALLILGGISLNCVAVSILLRPLSMYDNTQPIMTVEVHEPVFGHTESSELAKDRIQNQIVINIPEDDDEQVNEKSKFLEVDESKTLQHRDLNFASDLTKKDIDNSNLQDYESKETEKIQLVPVFTTYNADSVSFSHNDLHRNSALSFSTSSENCIIRENSTPVLDPIPQTQHSNKAENNFRQSDESLFCTKNSRMTTESAQKVCPHNSLTAESKSSHDDGLFSQQTEICKIELHHSQMREETGLSDYRKSLQCWSMQKLQSFIKSSVLWNPVAVMLILAGGLSTPGGGMYLSVLGLENGLQPEQVPWMLTIIGVADITAKLGIGHFADLGYFRPIRIVCMTQFAVGVMFQFTKFYMGLVPMIVMATIYGLTAGIIQALLTPMVVEMVGLSYLAQVTSIFYLATGVCTFALNVSVGAIRDASGSFTGGYNFIGGMVLTSLVILLLEPVFIMCRDRKSKLSRSLPEVRLTTQNDSG